MQQILLISEDFVKDTTNLSDNLSGKLINPAIYEAQQAGLRDILGDKLTDKLEDLIANNQIDLEANAKYKTLLLQSQYYLAYQVASNICLLTAVKIDNAGLSRVSDEKMNPISINEVSAIKDFYQKKADYYCYRLQNFILQHKSDYPELTFHTMHQIKSNLYSAASGGLWLGGANSPVRKYNGYRRFRHNYNKYGN